MNEQTSLIPLSYHLRNFNQYVKLDMDAAEYGNLTLVGGNTVGKTTLANCFLPMLIDGTIATPSFNSATNLKKLNSDAKVQNSKQHERTFESMLLGWGENAMAVRTGYSYVILHSARRRVILGLGAHRQSDGHKSATWWFVVISAADATDPLITTDADGHSLDKQAFQMQNASLGAELQVFDRADMYRNFVASQVYGFSDSHTLSQLAAVYRLLASPSLTGGDAKFSPILEALKNAQAGVDTATLEAAADSQRELNRLNRLVARIKAGQRRLKTMKKEIFLRNLNHLNDTLLPRYTALGQQQREAEDQAEAAAIAAKKLVQQLDLLAAALEKAEVNVNELTAAKLAQAQQVAQRSQYQSELDSQQRALAGYQRQLQRLEEEQSTLKQFQAQLNDLNKKMTELMTSEIKPSEAKLNALSAKLPEMSGVIAQTDPTATLKALQDYLEAIKRGLARYRSLEDQLANLSKDVAIVSKVQGQMGEAIDRDLQGPLVSRAKSTLQADNTRIHEAGAAEMNDQFTPLKTRETELLKRHPDLSKLLAAPQLLDETATLADQYSKLWTSYQTLTGKRDRLADQVSNAEEDVAKTQADIAAGIDPAQVTKRIAELKAALSALKIDETIADRLTAAKQHYQAMQKSQRDLSAQHAKQEQREATARENLDAAKQQQGQVGNVIEQVLNVLKPYFPVEEVGSIDALLAYVSANGSEIRNRSYGDLSDRIRQGIHRGDRDGNDDNALDSLFQERQHETIASQMNQRAIRLMDQPLEVIGVAFDINSAERLLIEDLATVTQALDARQSGNSLAQVTYQQAAVSLIAAQYRVVDEYNKMLTEGMAASQNIQLRIRLRPTTVSQTVIDEAVATTRRDRPKLTAEITRRLTQLANDAEVADDDDLFMARAHELLDIREWSAFSVWIKRRQSADFEEVDNRFVSSGGSGAEKAQAILLPLLLVPKMLLRQASEPDAPHLVMFDEFADKLDPDTARTFAQTIASFGFTFIATMPAGAQTKILADKVTNIAWEVFAAPQRHDHVFRPNHVQLVVNWGEQDA
ncbi:SbcC/MukB-like Walker B domain-containing protein [Lacticaseibacillus hegangensis]|uniref:SbcC/MukB-like Walker B domain-containing protein n=1 Tax=Lacticaseibacillus hegangensis TaxID=2486010 RepID=A0ABW4CVI5_9LACO|nr:SbcC/MukB-like Walker B domain-containing protein [Lacticaseibacillus hegangensis]